MEMEVEEIPSEKPLKSKMDNMPWYERLLSFGQDKS